MAKIAIINDTHAGQRNASDVFLDYMDKFYHDVFFPTCKALDIKTVIHGGDYLDNRKYVNFKALHRTRKSFLEPLVANQMKMIIIPGNHDVYYKNTNDLCGLREVLGYFIEDIQIIMKPAVKQIEELDIAFLPWIAPDNYADSMEFVGKAPASILISHLELAGFEMIKGMPTSTGGMDAALFNRFEMVLSGHYHTKSTRGNIHYLGTQFQQSWADCDDPKYFHVLDTVTRELVQIKNPFTLFERVIYDETDLSTFAHNLEKYKNKYVKIVVTKKSDSAKFDRFLQSIQDAGPIEQPRIIESFEEFASDRVEDHQIDLEDTGRLLHSYIDGIETSLNKERLKKMMNELFVEAHQTKSS